MELLSQKSPCLLCRHARGVGVRHVKKVPCISLDKTLIKGFTCPNYRPVHPKKES